MENKNKIILENFKKNTKEKKTIKTIKKEACTRN